LTKYKPYDKPINVVIVSEKETQTDWPNAMPAFVGFLPQL
jgi:hypothetical protein